MWMKQLGWGRLSDASAERTQSMAYKRETFQMLGSLEETQPKVVRCIGWRLDEALEDNTTFTSVYPNIDPDVEYLIENGGSNHKGDPDGRRMKSVGRVETEGSSSSHEIETLKSASPNPEFKSGRENQDVVLLGAIGRGRLRAIGQCNNTRKENPKTNGRRTKTQNNEDTTREELGQTPKPQEARDTKLELTGRDGSNAIAIVAGVGDRVAKTQEENKLKAGGKMGV
eukprot:Gb_37403 [translate_table: standard]